jgi:lysine 2,3-aminomutase
MCDMIPFSEHWRVSVSEAQRLQQGIMGYLPGFATPRVICDVPFVGKRWVSQVAEYDVERGISYWAKNYRTGIELKDPEALTRRYEYYDPIHTLPESGQAWWRRHVGETVDDNAAKAAASRDAFVAQYADYAQSLVGF